MSSNKKRARVSEVWKHFTPIGDADDPYTCLCKLCRESIPRSSTETTTLWSHLSKMHTAQHAVLKGKDLKRRASWAANLAAEEQESVRGSVHATEQLISIFLHSIKIYNELWLFISARVLNNYGSLHIRYGTYGHIPLLSIYQNEILSFIS
jgi:BED zinc finger